MQIILAFISAHKLAGVYCLSNSAYDASGTTTDRTAKFGFSQDLGSITSFSSVGGLNLGYNFNSVYNFPIRAELSYTLRSKINKQTDSKDASIYYIETDSSTGQSQDMSSDFSDTSTKSKIKAGMDTLMLNGYYDLYTHYGFTPYITAGVGLAFRTLSGNQDTATTYNGDANTISVENISKTDTSFAWRAGVGIAYEISENWAMDLSASYIYSVKITATKTTTYTSNTETSTLNTTLNSVDVLLGVRYTF